VPKWFFLVIIEPFFSIKGSLELSKEPYASYIEPHRTLISKSVCTQKKHSVNFLHWMLMKHIWY